MNNNLTQLAKKFISGEWQYNTHEKTLKKTFASTKELADLHLIDEAGYLEPAFKAAMTEALGNEVMSKCKGPFGDDDIFSGDIFEDETLYNLELHQISEETMDALQKNPTITIKIV